MPKNIVVIPVRGGSKRLPKKNIKLLGGIPLFVHSIRYAKKHPSLCHKIVVTTDDKTIKEIALKEAVTVIDRPKELSGDLIPTKAVLEHVVFEIKEEFDNLILLQATNPFRTQELLPKAFSKFAEGNYESLITVSENRQKFGKIKNNKFLPFNYYFGQRSQDLEPLFYENGLLYISKISLIKKGKIIGENNFPYIENHPLAKIDIDNQEDFELAEFYYQKIKELSI